ncbi:MAG TPA: TetR/AcrR family transcriptional regulator [Mycobacteriales bacterium]|nr:TetR/AcrR family transcriptional regulator [Mycobacteriales bacterium]
MPTNSPAAGAAETSWRDRAIERSLQSARARAVSRSDRFLQAAIQILSETGRTDFTVQELIDRSRTSLRSFYQHFSGKEELLLALFEEVIAGSVADWRAETATIDDPVDALHVVLERIHRQAGDPKGAGLNRALSVYHLQLADSRPSEYARVLAPLRELISEIVRRGVEGGSFRSDIEPETLAIIMMQTLVGAAHMHALGAELGGEPLDSEQLWDFCTGGLFGPTPRKKGTKA